MKKKIFIVAMVIMLFACVPLVACDKKSDAVKFDEKMSFEEICKLIDGLDSVTIEHDDYTEMIGSNFCIVIGSDGQACEFVENNIHYNFYYHKYEYSEYEVISIVDYGDFDTQNFKRWRGSELSQTKYWIKEQLTYNKYYVENGNLRIVGENSSIIKDCNSTLFIVPDRYADYKNRETTDDVVSFYLSNDATNYSVYISKYVVKYELPDSHEGLPIGVGRYGIQYLEELVLPANGFVLDESTMTYLDNKTELHVIYKGTKDQWKNIERVGDGDSWEVGTYLRVTCSDGEYVEESESL